MSYWFRGNWFTRAYPIKGVLAFRESMKCFPLTLDDFYALEWKALKSECRRWGVKTRGTKAGLRERLRSYYYLTDYDYYLTDDADQAGSSRKHPTKTTMAGGGGVKRRK